MVPQPPVREHSAEPWPRVVVPSCPPTLIHPHTWGSLCPLAGPADASGAAPAPSAPMASGLCLWCSACPTWGNTGHDGEQAWGGESAMSTQWPSQTPEAKMVQEPSPLPILPAGGQVLPSTCSPACCQPALTLPRPRFRGDRFCGGPQHTPPSLSSSLPGSRAPAAHPTPRAAGRNAGGWPPTSLPHRPEAPVLNSISCASGLHLRVSRD